MARRRWPMPTSRWTRRPAQVRFMSGAESRSPPMRPISVPLPARSPPRRAPDSFSRRRATASSHGGGNAIATASADITQASVSISGDVTVNAVAISQGEAGNAQARANLFLLATSGSITVGGHVDVNASAEDLHPGPGNAQANAIASLDASSSEAGIQIGSAHVTANALSEGPGAAKALAEFTLDPASIHISGDLEVTADALGTTGKAGGIAASANAQLIFADAGRIEVDGAMSVTAHATNFGLGQVKADGDLSFGSASSIDLADVTIDVKALNLGDGSGGAKARDTFGATSGISLHIDSLNLQAQASSHGGGNATATASADVTQDAISIAGDVTLNAVAFTVGSDGDAKARAKLQLIASTGSLFIGGNVQ